MPVSQVEPDPLELANARAEYGEAVRALRAMTLAAASGDSGAKRRVGEAQDRVNVAAAHLASLTA